MEPIKDSEYWGKEFDKFNFFSDYDIFPEKDWGEEEYWEQSGTGFGIVFQKDGSWAITMDCAENDYRMPMPDELVNLIQERSKTIKALHLK